MKDLIAYCIVNKKNPKLRLLELYEDKDVKIEKTEKIIKVLISEAPSPRTRKK